MAFPISCANTHRLLATGTSAALDSIEARAGRECYQSLTRRPAFAVADSCAGAIQRHRKRGTRFGPPAIRRMFAMQRIALGIIAFLAGTTLSFPLFGQVITAQPARTLNPSPPYSTAYPPAYSAYPPTYSAAPVTSLLQSPEANTIRGWYRDYLGRDAGQDLSRQRLNQNVYTIRHVAVTFEVRLHLNMTGRPSAFHDQRRSGRELTNAFSNKTRRQKII